MKKALKIFLIILIVILVILGIKMFLYFSEPSYDKSLALTNDEIVKIFEKRKDLQNIYVKYTKQQKIGDLDNETLFTEIFLKDELIKEVATTKNGKLKIMQEDRATGNVLWIFETKDTVMKMNNSSMGVFSTFEKNDIPPLEDSNLVEYLGKTKIDERNVVVIKLQEEWNYKEIFFIDEETGIVLKHITKTPLLTLTDVAEIKVGSVKDEDVEFIDYKVKYPEFKVAGE